MILTEQFKNIEETIFNGSSQSISRIIEFWPNILGALGVILVGWLLGMGVEKIILSIAKKFARFHISEKTGFLHFLEKAGVHQSPSKVVASFLNGYVVMIFFIAAAQILHLNKIGEFLNSVINYIPNLVIALFIVLIGVQVGTTTANIVQSTLQLAKSNAAKIIAAIAKYIIVIFAVMAALIELRIAETLVQILFIGFISMLALAGGLAFGLGGKDLVRELLEDMKSEQNKGI